MISTSLKDVFKTMIEARLTDALVLVLYDTENEKIIKSFPKKGVDPEKRQKAVAQFELLKTQTKETMTREVNKLKALYVSGKGIEVNHWISEYLHDPIKTRIAQLLVWVQKTSKNDNYFTVSDKATILSDQKPYTLSEHMIFLAHPLEMQEMQIKEWGSYYSQKGLKQPFAQIMYEPLIHWDKKTIASHFEGATISSKERNLLKKKLSERGVFVQSNEMEREYNYRTGRYVFSNSNTMSVGESLVINYTVDEESKDITFGKCCVKSSYTPREMNTILLEFDKATINYSISKDRDYVLSEDNLACFTVAQITMFLNLSINNNASRCTAWLLDYKNRKYPEYEGIDEFTLEF